MAAPRRLPDKPGTAPADVPFIPWLDNPSWSVPVPLSPEPSYSSPQNVSEEEVLMLAESLFRERAGADLSLSIPSSVSFIDEMLLLLRVDGRCLRSSSRLYMRNSIVSTITTDLRLDRVGWSTLRQLLLSITRRITTMRGLFE